jgi:hypothetical protein
VSGVSRVPDTVKIGSLTFEVEHVPPPLKNDENHNLYGCISYLTQKIKLEASVKPDKAWQVFWHECLHGIADEAGVEMEEGEVLALGKVLAAFMLDNGFVKAGPETAAERKKREKLLQGEPSWIK